MGLFARRGFDGTTTRQISKRAGVNEAIIFRHFRTKEGLYWAVIEEKCRLARGNGNFRGRLSRNEDDRQTFAAIAEEILRRNHEDATVSRLLLYSALQRHGLSHRFFRTYVADRSEILAEHIQKRVDAGHFRRVDPLLAARSFLGMVVYHVLIEELFGKARSRRLGPRAVGKALAGIWLEGMLTRPASGLQRRNGPGRDAREQPFSGDDGI